MFLAAAPVNKDEGELIEALGVIDPEAMGIQPEGIAMEPEADGIHPDIEPEAEAMGIDIDMLLSIPMLPLFIMSETYETYTVSDRFLDTAGVMVVHTSIIAGPATMLSSVACLSP